MKISVISISLLMCISPVCFSQIQGNRYCGNYTLSSPITLNGVTNQVIDKLQISNPAGHCIELINCHNITIQNCKLGPALDQGVQTYGCSNIKVIDCIIDSIAAGVYSQLSQEISITNNDFKNLIGPFPRGEAVQFNQVTGIGNKINYNVIENIMGQSYPEDIINLYKSGGTFTDSIQIIGNWIRGGGPSTSGGGINCSDAGGSYVICKNNILVNPGQYGIAITGGSHIAIINNKVFAKKQAFTNVGIYAWNQYPVNCDSNRIENNEVYWINKTGTVNCYWDGGNCGTIAGWNTNACLPSIDSTILPLKIIGKNCNATYVDEEINVDDISIFPTPAKEYVTIEFMQKKEMTIELYTITCQKIIQKRIDAGNRRIDVSQLSPGLYFAKIYVNDLCLTRKIIIQE